MALECSNCGLEIDIDSIDMETMTVNCPRCSTFLDFSDAIQPEEAPPPKVVNAPENFTVTELKDGSRIAFSWMSWRSIVYFTVGLVLAATPVMMFNAIGGEGFSIPLILLPVFLLIILIGLAVMYYGLALFLNSTTITVNDAVVSVKHGPLPLRASHSYRRSDVKQVISQQIAHRNQYGETYTYEVHLQLQDGTQKVLVKGFPRREQADYIRQQLYSAGIRA